MILRMPLTTARSAEVPDLQKVRNLPADRRFCRPCRASPSSLSWLSCPPRVGARRRGFVGVTERGASCASPANSPLADHAAAPARHGARRAARRARPRPRGVVAVGSSARLYALDPVTARATGSAPRSPRACAARASRSPWRRAPTGAAALRRRPGPHRRPPDGRDHGGSRPSPRATTAPRSGPPSTSRSRARCSARQLTPLSSIQREPAPGTSTFAATALETPTEFGLGEPLAFSLGSNGTGYVLAVLSDRRRDRQSALLTIDSATGRFAPPRGLGFQSFARG